MTIPNDVMKQAMSLAGWTDPKRRTLEIARAIMAERKAKWQPIETAPKDGTEIILFCPQGDGRPGKTYRVTAGHWYEPDPDEDLRRMCLGKGEPEPPAWLSWDGGFSEDTMMPTHWTHLPQPPSGKE